MLPNEHVETRSDIIVAIMSHFTRRTLLKTFPAVATATRLLGQQKAQLPVKALSHATLTVSDVKRSTEFYQGLFGMGITARQGTAPSLQIGSGVQFIFFAGGGPNAKPGINHYCMAIDNFSVDGVAKVLTEHGLSKAEGQAGGMTGGAMKFKIRMRPENLGGAKNGTAEFYLGDPDGLAVQIQDTRYCGGGGELGEICYAKAEPAPTKGLLQIENLSHFTLFVKDVARTQAFYQDIFALPMQGHQGATPMLGTGDRSFLTIAGSGTRPAELNHLCFRMKNFNQEKVLKALADYGIAARGDAVPGAPAPPLKSYVSMRMPNRGGAPNGTAELYFTDPDGILIQLQDMSYCGGGGELGETCDGK